MSCTDVHMMSSTALCRRSYDKLDSPVQTFIWWARQPCADVHMMSSTALCRRSYDELDSPVRTFIRWARQPCADVHMMSSTALCRRSYDELDSPVQTLHFYKSFFNSSVFCARLFQFLSPRSLRYSHFSIHVFIFFILAWCHIFPYLD
jgi:phage terminase large subunit-like protein